jgi:altronate dehydratase large subunit
MRAARHFLGYRRGDGGIGVRNNVLVLSAMDVTNPLARRIAAAVAGTLAITTWFGRAQQGEETALHERALVGLARNPNVAAALVVGFEPTAVERIAAAISGKSIRALSVLQDGGMLELLHKGIAASADLVARAGDMAREPVPLSELVLGLKCGGSDPTSGLVANAVLGRVADRVVEAGGTVILTETEDLVGAEHLLARRAPSPEVAARLLAAVGRLEEQAMRSGARLSSLHEDHIAAGITTNEEKALGSIQKAGTSPLNEVIDYGRRPAGKGLIFMDGQGGGIPEITGLAAAGAQVIAFVTGTGHPTGHPVAPTLKLTGNPRTAARFRDSIDVDVSDVLSGRRALSDAADRLEQELVSISGGKMTRNEMLGDVETTIASVTAWMQHLVGARVPPDPGQPSTGF